MTHSTIKNNKKKIAVVSDAIYPYNKGGKEKRIYEISARLAKKGYQVTIYCMKWWKGKENTRKENEVTLKAISPYYPLYSGKRRSIKEAVMFTFACFKLIKEDFDVIDVDHMPHLVLFPLKIIAILKRKKLIVTWNEVWGKDYWLEYLGKPGMIAYIVEWLSARMPDKIISISEHTKKRLAKDLKVKNDICVIPNGINFKQIQKVKASNNKSDVIFAGRLLVHKNVDILIKSIAILKESNPVVKCLIIGEGPEKKRLREMVATLNLTKNVLFLDFFKDHDELYSLIKSSKVFVLPSTREGFGIVALEANACGIPVITTNYKDNAARDLINAKNGLMVKLNEIEISNSIKKILNQKINSKDCIDAAKICDWSNIINKLEVVYKK